MKPETLAGLTAHRDSGLPVGNFLTYVLENNLVQSVCHADEQNLADIVEIAKWVYMEMPGGAWGSPEKVRTWQKNHGAQGFMKQRLRWNSNNNRLELVEG